MGGWVSAFSFSFIWGKAGLVKLGSQSKKGYHWTVQMDGGHGSVILFLIEMNMYHKQNFNSSVIHKMKR